MYTVPTCKIPLLYDPPFVVLLFLLGTAAGYRLLRLLKLPLETASRLERGVLCAATGLGLLQYPAFTLGMLHRLTPRSVGACLVIIGILLLPDSIRITCSIVKCAITLGASSLWRPLLGAAVLLTIPFLQALCPCTDNDGLGYHLRAPKNWLQSGSLDFLPTLIHTNSPMGVEMIFLLPMAVWSDTAAKLTHFAFTILTLLAIYALGRRLCNSALGLWSALAYALAIPGAPVLALSTWAYVEMGLTLQIVCTLLAWDWWCRTRNSRWLISSALCAGFAFSDKLTGILIIVTLTVLTAWEMYRSPLSENTGSVTSQLISTKWWQKFTLIVGIGILPGLPWLWRAWLLTGNPIYPFLPQVFPTRDWSVVQGAAFDAMFRYYNWGSTRIHWGIGFRRTLLLMIIIGFILCVAASWQFGRDTIFRCLLLFALLPTLAGLISTGPYGRYFIPLLPIYVVAILWRLQKHGQLQPYLRIGISVLCVINALIYVRSSKPGIIEAIKCATGRTSREQYLNARIPPMPLWTYLNTQVPPSSRVMVVGFGDVYYCDPYCYIVKGYHQQRIRLDSWQHFLADTRTEQIDYLILSPGSEGRVPFGPEYLPTQNENVLPHRLARLYGSPCASASDLTLYRLTLPTTK